MLFREQPEFLQASLEGTTGALLVFATMFNFWFDADSPADEIHRLTFFKPGSPEYVDFAAPPISVAKTETSIGPYVVGDTISFDIAATNDCNVTLHSVVATDLSAVVGGCTPAQPSTLAPAEVMICPATHVVTQADVDAGSYTNSATGGTRSRGLQPMRPPPPPRSP